MSLVEFEKWFEGNESKFEYPRLAHKSAKQAWNYQQAKIDDLQKLRSLDEMAINQLAQANQVWRTKCDELQARVVELTKTMSEVQMMSHKSISYEHDLFDKGWNQASKQVVMNIHRLTGIGEGLLK